MDKKKILIIVGVVAVAGIGFYLWKKRKKSTDEKESSDSVEKPTDESKSTSTDSTTPTSSAPKSATPTSSAPKSATPTTSTQPSVKKLTPQELEARLQSGCGKKPLLKKNKVKYEQCRSNLTAKLRSQGLVSFDGSYTFENFIDSDFYSDFDNNFDITI